MLRPLGSLPICSPIGNVRLVLKTGSSESLRLRESRASLLTFVSFWAKSLSLVSVDFRLLGDPEAVECVDFVMLVRLTSGEGGVGSMICG